MFLRASPLRPLDHGRAVPPDQILRRQALQSWPLALVLPMSGLTSSVGNKRSICEVHRELYDLAHAHLSEPALQEFTDKLEEAYAMAKKMQAKLRQYKENYDEGWWERQKAEIVQDKLALREGR